MSNLRAEKNCLNCGHQVEEIYCPHCGQKNIVTHVNAFHALGEFVGDYFHADGKFLKSMIPLLFRPGYMTNEYNAGRRQKFIHPFRLYIFVTIVYFSISFLGGDSTGSVKIGERSPATVPRISLGNSGFVAIRQADTSGVQNDSAADVLNDRAAKLPATLELYRDSVKKLDKEKRPRFSDDIVNRVAIKFKNEGGASELVNSTLEKFKHSLPKLLFFLLPLAALLLKLFYIRRKRFYVDHLVYTLHLHSFIFLLLTIYAFIRLFAGGGYIFSIAVLLMIIYFFVSMRRVYGQSKTKTFLKGMAFLFSYLIFLTFVFAAGFLYIFIYD